LHAEQELAGRQLSDPFTMGVLEIVRFKAFVCFNLHPVCCKKERGLGEEKEKEEEEEEEEVAVRRTWGDGATSRCFGTYNSVFE
jgi:hypothetical protein